MKNSNNTIGNRTRDLPACRAVPQPAAPPRAPLAGGECPKSTHRRTQLMVGMHEYLQSNNQALPPDILRHPFTNRTADSNRLNPPSY